MYYFERHHWGKLIHVFAEDSDADCDKVEVKFLKPRPNNFFDWGKGTYIYIRCLTEKTYRFSLIPCPISVTHNL